MRRGQAAAAAILIECSAADERKDAIAVPLCIGEPLQDDHGAPFGANIAVCRFVERVAAPGRRHHARARRNDGGIGQQGDVDSTRERHVGLARAQALDGEVHGHK